MRPRSRHPLLALVLSAGLVSCGGTTPAPGDAGYPNSVSGSYVGRLVIEGNPFDATLQLRSASGGRVTGALRVADPITIEGRVEGVVIDDLLRITISYRSPEGCDGSIEGILTVAERGGALDGPVTVDDCAAPVAGRMTFRTRPR